jgi:hypothetical protein
MAFATGDIASFRRSSGLRIAIGGASQTIRYAHKKISDVFGSSNRHRERDVSEHRIDSYPVDAPLPQPGAPVKRRTIAIEYTNYRGERSIRNIMPMQIFFGCNKFHDGGDQWFLEALDVDKKPAAVRHFAVKDIHRWNA